jgi:hypothetical protein
LVRLSRHRGGVFEIKKEIQLKELIRRTWVGGLRKKEIQLEDLIRRISGGWPRREDTAQGADPRMFGGKVKEGKIQIKELIQWIDWYFFFLKKESLLVVSRARENGGAEDFVWAKPNGPRIKKFDKEFEPVVFPR